jgi:AcrR family transcriptional regulator
MEGLRVSSFVAMNRRIEQGQATRRSLLDAARELFVEHGYEATSIELVLERAAISRGALYHHFQSKRDLYEAVLEDSEARLADGIMRATDGIKDPVAAIKAGCSAFLGMVREPDIKRIVLTDALTVIGWERWREIDERYAFGILKLSLSAAPVAARLTKPEQDVLAHVLLAALLELGMIVARAEQPRSAQASAQAALDELLERLLAA